MMQESHPGKKPQQQTVYREVKEHSSDSSFRRDLFPDDSIKEGGHNSGLDKTPELLEEHI